MMQWGYAGRFRWTVNKRTYPFRWMRELHIRLMLGRKGYRAHRQAEQRHRAHVQKMEALLNGHGHAE